MINVTNLYFKMLFHQIIFLLISTSLALDYPIVKTSLGTVQGYYKESYNKRRYSAFEGIPFAQSPTGNLRFREPVEVVPWEGTLNANKSRICLQAIQMPGLNSINGEENCLGLNVYVPKENIAIEDNFDVIVNIHGGAFMLGSPEFAGPKFLIDRNIIYVSINYRLGPFGFLSTEDDIVPGNMGLKDQVLALKWVQKHIIQFGGNPKSITLTGVSAGGAAVHFHYFSKLSKGLFHRGISNSGTALAPWALQENALVTTKTLAATLGCYSDSNKIIIDCMKEKPADEIINNVKQLFSSNYGMAPLVLFAPVIEKPSSSAFLVDHPINLFQTENFNDLPWISSISEMEGNIAEAIIGGGLVNLNDKWNQDADVILDYNFTACDSDKLLIARKIKEHYFGTQKLDFDNYKTLIKLMGDRYFALSHEKSTRMQAIISKSNVFAYMYAYKSTIMQSVCTNPDDIFCSVVGHGEDSVFMYSGDFDEMSMMSEKFDENDTLMKELFLDMIIHFIKNDVLKLGSVQLEPVDNSEDFIQLYIRDPNNFEIQRVKELSPTEFWNSLPIRENEKFSETKCNENLESVDRTEL